MTQHQYGIHVDDICDVLHIGPVPGSRNVRIWAKPRNAPGLVLQFDLPSPTIVGKSGRLMGRRHGAPVGLLEEVARNCGLSAPDYRNDFVYDEGLLWTPDVSTPDLKTTRKVYDPGNLPVSLNVAAGSFWAFNGRKIQILSSTGNDLDSILQVRVIHSGAGKRGSAKKVSVRTLLSRYTPA
jgi:hypothetical protein